MTTQQLTPKTSDSQLKNLKIGKQRISFWNYFLKRD